MSHFHLKFWALKEPPVRPDFWAKSRVLFAKIAKKLVKIIFGDWRATKKENLTDALPARRLDYGLEERHVWDVDRFLVLQEELHVLFGVRWAAQSLPVAQVLNLRIK